MVLPHNLIYGSLIAGLAAALAVICSDGKQMDGIRNLFAGRDKLARFQRVYLPGFLLAMLLAGRLTPGPASRGWLGCRCPPVATCVRKS